MSTYFAYWCHNCKEVVHPEYNEIKYLGEIGDYYVTKVRCPVCRKRQTIKEKTVTAWLIEQAGIK